MEGIGEYVEVLKEDALHVEEGAMKEYEAFVGRRECWMWCCFKCIHFILQKGIYFPLTRTSE